MKWLRALKVVVLVMVLLGSGFHWFWMLVPQAEIFGSSELRRYRRPRLRLPFLSTSERNLSRLHRAVETCLQENGDGLRVITFQRCKIRLQYPNGTENSWVYRKPESGAEVQEARNLTWDYNLCTVMNFWRKAKTCPAVVTKDVFDCYLKDNPKRVLHHFVSRDMCKTREDCFHRVRRFLPHKQPFAPGQAGRCALVGNAASLKSNITFGDEIDAHDTVIRLNDAKIGDQYTRWAGQKTTFRFVNERVTKALITLIRKARIRNETLVLRRALGGTTLKKLQDGSLRNPVYVSPITPTGSGLEADPLLGYSSGFLALNFAMSICKSVDMYGFSIDPGPQKSWPRYFSNPRFGHTPLTHRAYFLLLECLGVVRLKSSSRILNGRGTTFPAAEVIRHGYTAASRDFREEYQPGAEPIDRSHCTAGSYT